MIAWPFSCFDTIGSLNAGYFTYDGDQSGQRNQNVAAGDVPGGSAGIERTRLWRGNAGQPFDPNYHTPRDTIDDVNLEALAIMGPGVAFTIGTSRSRSTG